MQIEVIVRDKIARTGNKHALAVCGNSDYVIKFDFDPEWGAYEAKTARFKWNDSYTDVPFTGNECPMPIITNAFRVEIGVYAGELHTTSSAVLPMRRSILCGNETESEVSQKIKEDLDKSLKEKIDRPQTAEVGELLAVEEVDEQGKPVKWKTVEQVQADWNESDENSSAYVKNRPFYSEPPVELGTFPMTCVDANILQYTTESGERENIADLEQYLQSVWNEELFLFTANINGQILEFTSAYSEMGETYLSGDGSWGTIGWNSIKISGNQLEVAIGSTYDVLFADETTRVKTIDEIYFPDTIFSQKNAPVRFGAGELAAVQGSYTTAGYSAHAEGGNTTASGFYSHAEGGNTTASGSYSHAEGGNTTASGSYSHAEGGNTTASGSYSHAEGGNTTASGFYSHAEGIYTTANRARTVVFGCANLPDEETVIYKTHTDRAYFYTTQQYSVASAYRVDESSKSLVLISPETKTGDELPVGWYVKVNSTHIRQILRKVETSGTNVIYEIYDLYVYFGDSRNVGKYALIVGNGILDRGDSGVYKRSNAHTLDRDGNAWFSGDVYVGSTSGTNRDEGSQKLVTEKTLNDALGDFSEEFVPVVVPTIMPVTVSEDGNFTIGNSSPLPLELLVEMAINGMQLKISLLLLRGGVEQRYISNSEYIPSENSGVWNFPSAEENAMYKLAWALDESGNPTFAVTKEPLPSPTDHIILSSSTPDSAKRFRITVDDSGTIFATEIVE